MKGQSDTIRPEHLAHQFRKNRQRILRTSVAPHCEGSGVIIAGGGRYTSWALQVATHCRKLDPAIPIEVWCLHDAEIADRQPFLNIGVEVISAAPFLVHHPMRRFGGWHLKMFATLHSRLRNVLFLDADCFPTAAGLALLSAPEFTDTGALFFQDVRKCRASDAGYSAASLLTPERLRPPVQEWETGQFLVDKHRFHAEIRLACWMHEHSDAWWRSMHGDKTSTEIAFRSLAKPYGLAPKPRWAGWGIEHSVGGKVVARHAMAWKRGEHPMPESFD